MAWWDEWAQGDQEGGDQPAEDIYIEPPGQQAPPEEFQLSFPSDGGGVETYAPGEPAPAQDFQISYPAEQQQSSEPAYVQATQDTPTYDPGPSPTALWGMAQANVPQAQQQAPNPGNWQDEWVEDERERRHWVNGNVVERIPKQQSGSGGGGGGTVTQPGGGSTSSGGSSVNWDAAKMAAELANNNAQREYLNRRMNELEIPEMKARTELEKDELAFEKVQADIRNALEARMQAEGERHALVGEQQAGERLALDKATGERSTSMDLLKMYSDLARGGPANAFQYAKTLSGTPNGLSDLIAGALGRFELPGYGTGQEGAVRQGGENGVLRALGAGGDGTVGGALQGGEQGGALSLQNVLGQAGAGGLEGYEDPNTLPTIRGNMIDPRSAKIIAQNPYMLEFLNAAIEQQGGDPRNVWAEFAQSLPKYGATGGTGGRIKLRRRATAGAAAA